MNENLQIFFYFFCNLNYFINFREEPYLFTEICSLNKAVWGIRIRP